MAKIKINKVIKFEDEQFVITPGTYGCEIIDEQMNWFLIEVQEVLLEDSNDWELLK